jgi:glycosyltransferase involved in cell wall biosynthesis
MKKVLYLFSANYPYGQGETFVHTELPFLKKEFDAVRIYPFAAAQNTRDVPAGCEVKEIINGRTRFSAGAVLRRNFFLSLRIMAIEFFHNRRKIYFLSRLRYFLNLVLRAIYDADLIAGELRSNENVAFYSTWLNDWALALAVLRIQKKIPAFTVRCGGYDIYDERHEGNYLPFRYFVYSQAREILPNSYMGEAYLKNKGMFRGKISTSYLGTMDHGLNPFDAGKTFTIVSCSALIPLKRVHLIIDILARLTFPIRWVHFGTGPLMSEITALAKALPANVEAELRGGVTNAEIFGFYKKESVNLFVTTSETEGLPITIQEAASFGIPILATNVGGIPELVGPETGILIDKAFDPVQVSQKIDVMRTSAMNSMEFRYGVRRNWEQRFNAAIVYADFAAKLAAAATNI